MNHTDDRMAHAFTVDVEDWYHGGPDDMLRTDGMSRLANGLDRLLDLLQEHQAKATFFWLGEAAMDNPALLRKVIAQGHELGCHGHRHRHVHRMSPSAFKADITQATDTLSQIAGVRPSGYRAPYFSLSLDTLWAFSILQEAGIAYDSSVFPHRPGPRAILPLHGGPQWVKTASGWIAELPMSSCQWGPAIIPACGGAYFRAYPYALTRRNMRWLEARGHFANFYIHPWELDPGHPRLPSTWRQALIHNHGMGSVDAKLRRLMRDFRFTTLGDKLAQLLADGNTLPRLAPRGDPLEPTATSSPQPQQ